MQLSPSVAQSKRSNLIKEKVKRKRLIKPNIEVIWDRIKSWLPVRLHIPIFFEVSLLFLMVEVALLQLYFVLWLESFCSYKEGNVAVNRNKRS